MIEFNVIYKSFLIFFMVLFFHILIWRILKPKKHITSLLLVFIIIPFLFLGCLLKIFFNTIDEFLLVILLHFALSFVYIQTYPAIQAWSPSLFITFLLGQSNKAFSIKEISEQIGEDSLVNDRVEDLQKEGLIVISQDSLIFLTRKGYFLANIFILYRKILGLEEGKG